MPHMGCGLEHRCQGQLPPDAWPGHLQLLDVCGVGEVCEGQCAQNPPKRLPVCYLSASSHHLLTLVVVVLEPAVGQLQGQGCIGSLVLSLQAQDQWWRPFLQSFQWWAQVERTLWGEGQKLVSKDG
jgi:hypothetical protein